VRRIPADISPELLETVKTAHIIGVHGANGSGKTYTIKEIVRKIHRGTHVQFDCYLSKSATKKPYFDRLRLDRLAIKIERARPPVFLDCFILLDVLGRMNIDRPELLIYCERAWENPVIIDHYTSREMRDTFEAYCGKWHPERLSKPEHCFKLIYPN